MLFYPSHDIALGNGVRHFNPPAAALRLQEDLAWLADIWNQGRTRPLPWGWDWDTRQYLHQACRIPLKELPDDAQLEALRQLSSRQTTIHILQQLGYQGEMPQFLATIDDVRNYINVHNAQRLPFVLKTPWSSSGRGLILWHTPQDELLKRASAALRRMGGMMGERWLDKKQDFAMLFYIGSEDVRFAGFSLFDNGGDGTTYRQGYLLSDTEIEKRLTSILNKTQPAGSCQTGSRESESPPFRELQNALVRVLTGLFHPFFHLPWEVGYVGIDMMITDRGIMPCVEMNVRCTMGVVARLWSDRHLQPGETGRFYISPMDQDGHFEARFEKD